MDRRENRSRSRVASASMAALAAAAAAGEAVGAENGTVAPMDEDQKPPAASLGGPSSPAPTAAVPVSARRGAAASPAGGGGPSCQAERCGADLTDARRYHRRHKVCEAHAKAPVVIVAGLRQRFCQQCSRFHELSEFDDIKKSCRKRLAGHNERRRKSSADPNGGGTAGDGWRHGGDQDGRGHPAGNPQLNNLQIR